VADITAKQQVKALFDAFDAHLKTLCATPLASLRAPSMLHLLMLICACSMVQNRGSRASATSLIDQRLNVGLNSFCSARWRLRYKGGSHPPPPATSIGLMRW
jgi:hypothetical protein